MVSASKERLIRVLRWSERYTKTDMVYFASGNFWLGVSRIVSIITGIVLTTALANLLPPSTYGFLDYIIASASMISAFTITGLGAAVLNHTARGDDGIFRESIRRGIKWYIPSVIIALGIAGYYFLKSDERIAWAFLIVAACAPFGILGNYKSFLQGKKDFRTQTLFGIIRTAVPVACLIATAAIWPDPLAIIAAYFIPGALTSLAIYFYTVRKYKVPAKSQNYEAAMSFAKHTSVIGFLMQISARIDQFFIWHFMGPESVATYSIATSPVEELKNVPANMLSVAAPRLAVQKDSDIRAMISRKIKQMLFIVTPIAALYIIAAPFIFKTLFPQYIGAIIYSQIYALVLLLQPQNLIDTALLARDDVKIRRKIIVTNQILKLCFVGIGIWYFGIWGGIGALMLSELVNSTLLLLALRKLV